MNLRQTCSIWGTLMFVVNLSLFCCCKALAFCPCTSSFAGGLLWTVNLLTSGSSEAKAVFFVFYSLVSGIDRVKMKSLVVC